MVGDDVFCCGISALHGWMIADIDRSVERVVRPGKVEISDKVDETLAMREPNASRNLRNASSTAASDVKSASNTGKSASFALRSSPTIR